MRARSLGSMGRCRQVRAGDIVAGLLISSSTSSRHDPRRRPEDMSFGQAADTYTASPSATPWSPNPGLMLDRAGMVVT